MATLYKRLSINSYPYPLKKMREETQQAYCSTFRQAYCSPFRQAYCSPFRPPLLCLVHRYTTDTHHCSISTNGTWFSKLTLSLDEAVASGGDKDASDGLGASIVNLEIVKPATSRGFSASLTSAITGNNNNCRHHIKNQKSNRYQIDMRDLARGHVQYIKLHLSTYTNARQTWLRGG